MLSLTAFKLHKPTKTQLWQGTIALSHLPSLCINMAGELCLNLWL